MQATVRAKRVVIEQTRLLLLIATVLVMVTIGTAVYVGRSETGSVAPTIVASEELHENPRQQIAWQRTCAVAPTALRAPGHEGESPRARIVMLRCR